MVAVYLIGLRVQRGQQTLAGQVIERQTVGAFCKVLLNVLIALRKLLYQIGRAVEVSDYLVLIGVETLLNVIQLALSAVRNGVGQQTCHQKTNDDTGHQGERRQQPD